MRYALFFFLFILFVRCNNDDLSEVIIPFSYIETNSSIDCVTRDKVFLHYKADANKLKETGVFYSVDSMSVAMHVENLNKSTVSFNAKDTTYSCQITNLEFDTKYWIQIYFKDKYDNISYSKIYSVTTKGFNLRLYGRACVVVERGPGCELGIAGDQIDTLKRNSKITYNGNVCSFNFYTDSDGRYFYGVDIPVTAPLGIHKLALYYKNRLIYENNIETINVAVCNIVTKHPDGDAAPSSFVYNNEAYIFSAYRSNFYKWNPQGNQWTQLNVPAEIGSCLRWGYSGYEIDGVVYFPTITHGPLRNISRDFKNYIISYDPNLDVWKKIDLIKLDNIIDNFYYSSFLHDKKIYSFVGQENKVALRVFDPTDCSLKIAIDSIPIPRDCGFGLKSAVVNGNVYVLISRCGWQEYASTYFKNELYLFDVLSGKFTRIKELWEYAEQKGFGKINPYLFEYNGLLCVYGGESSQGYINSLSRDYGVYDPASGKWLKIRQSVTSSSPSFLNGCVLKLNGKVYIGLGLGMSYNYSSDFHDFNIR